MAGASTLSLVGAADKVPDVNVPETADVDTESRQRNSLRQNGRTLMSWVQRCGSWPSLPSGAPTDPGPRRGRTSVELQPATSFPPYAGRSSHATQQRRCGLRGVVRRSTRRWHKAATSHLTSHSSVQCERAVLLPHSPLPPLRSNRRRFQQSFRSARPNARAPWHCPAAAPTRGFLCTHQSGRGVGSGWLRYAPS